MRNERLRVYIGPGSNDQPTATERETVRVPLTEVFPLLSDAIHNQRTWLRDFENDEITISTDLYELILAYQHYHRPSA